VEAALHTLTDASQVDGRRMEAARAYASATGTHGNQTQVEQRAAEEFDRAQKACTDLGDIPEIPETDQSPGALQADAQSKAAEEAARRFEEIADHHRHLAEQAETVRSSTAYQVEQLQKDREHLDTIAQSYQDLLISSPRDLADVDQVVPPGDDRAVGDETRAIRKTLEESRSNSANLDEERRKAVRGLRAWVTESRFEALQNQVARHFGSADDGELENHALSWQQELRLRIETINAQLAEMNQHRDILLTETLEAGEEGLALLRSASNQSRLPDHLPRLGGAQFLRITTHAPEALAERRGRIGELIDEIVDIGEIPSGIPLVQQAVRRLGKPIRVKVLNPDPDLDQDAVDITDMARFSGGEQLTSAILLYCSLAQLRARTRGLYRKPSSVLILDNPIGRASRVRFLELQRDVARAMGVQLLYTTGVNDHDALRTLPNVIRLRNQRIDRNSGNRLVEFAAEDGSSVEATRIVRGEAGDAS
jgi:DNA repair exonuclease SbcCD ATPase subunit